MKEYHLHPSFLLILDINVGSTWIPIYCDFSDRMPWHIDHLEQSMNHDLCSMDPKVKYANWKIDQMITEYDLGILSIFTYES